MGIRWSHLAPALVTALLGGCVDTLPEAHVARGDVRNAIAKGEMTSPRAASVAMASMEGAPESVTARFDQIFAKEAGDREITIAAPGDGVRIQTCIFLFIDPLLSDRS